jgi:hypothetical protein
MSPNQSRRYDGSLSRSMFFIRCVSLVCQSAPVKTRRYIGHLGVRDEFNPLTSLNRAQGAVQSVVSHLLDPDDTSVVLAAHMIRSISYRAPYPWSPLTHSEAVRYFLGHQLPDALRVESSLFHRAYFHSIMAMLKIVYFVSYCIPWKGSFPQSRDENLSHPLIQHSASVEKALALSFLDDLYLEEIVLFFCGIFARLISQLSRIVLSFG